MIITPKRTESGARRRGFSATVRMVAFTMAGFAILLLHGCDYSVLTRSAVLAAWSPDGSRLAVCIDNTAADAAELWLVEPESGTKTLLISGERARGLPHLLVPRWSVDGRRLYCVRTVPGEEDELRPAVVIEIDPATGDHRELSVVHYTGSRSSHFSDTDVLVPLADGMLAAQDRDRDGQSLLVRIDPTTGIGSPFPIPAGSWMVVSGSPDGNRLAVALPGPGEAGITIIFSDSSGTPLRAPLELAQRDESRDPQPTLTWSPDSKWIALLMEGRPESPAFPALPATAGAPLGEDAEDTATLILIDTESAKDLAIACDAFGMPPIFSPDGTHLAWTASARIQDGDDDMLLEARITNIVNGSTITASLPGMVFPMAWSTDSSRVACYHGFFDDSNGPGAMFSVTTDGSGTRVVTRHQQDRLAVPSPTGGRLAWVSGSGAVQVLDPGTGRVLFHAGLTAAGTLQAGEDHLLQERPEAALETWSALDSTQLSAGQSARLAAGSYAALRTLERPGEAARLLERICSDLPQKEDPPAAFLILCGALSDFGFRPEAERVVEQQIIARYPDSPEAMDALWALAALKQDEGDAEAALHYLERLLRSYPGERKEVVRALLLATLAETGENKALVIELAGMIIEANGDPENSDQTAPRAVAHYARAMALDQNGNSEHAREAYAAALAQRTQTKLSDGRNVADLCWEALLRLARSETPAARR